MSSKSPAMSAILIQSAENFVMQNYVMKSLSIFVQIRQCKSGTTGTCIFEE